MQTTRSIVLHFADVRPIGTLAHLTGGPNDFSFAVRIILPDQATFWALVFHLARPLANSAAIAAAIWSNQPIIHALFDCFKADAGSERPQETTRLDSIHSINGSTDDAPLITRVSYVGVFFQSV